jgi:Fic family protein
MLVPRTGTVILEAVGRSPRLTRSSTRRRRRSVEAESRKSVGSYLEQALLRGTPVSEPFVLGLHTRVVAEHATGGYRGGPVRVRWQGKIVYVAPKADEVPLLMKDFFEKVGDVRGEVVNHAGRTLLRLLKIHPFTQGNGRTARGVATYLLLRAGYHERPFRTLEKYIDDHLEGYYESLALSSEEAPGPWDAYFSGAVGEVFGNPGTGKARDLFTLVRGRARGP